MATSFFGAAFFGGEFFFAEVPVEVAQPPAGGDSSHRKLRQKWLRQWLKWKQPELFALPADPERAEATRETAKGISQVVAYLTEHQYVEWDAALLMLKETEHRVALALADAETARVFREIKARVEREAREEEADLMELLDLL